MKLESLPEKKKNTLKTAIIGAATLLATAPSLAQKVSNQEKKVTEKVYTDLAKYKKAEKEYKDSLENYKWWKQQREHADSMIKENLWVGTPENGHTIDVSNVENFYKVANFYEKHPRLKKIANSNPPNNLTKYWEIGKTRYAEYGEMFKKPTQKPVYKEPETKKDTIVVPQKPPEQRALENKKRDTIPVQETKNKFFAEGNIVYGPNQHMIGFYNLKNNTFTAIPEKYAKDYGMHPEDFKFLANTDSLKNYLKARLKMDNIKIEKPE